MRDLRLKRFSCSFTFQVSVSVVGLELVGASEVHLSFQDSAIEMLRKAFFFFGEF